MSSLLDLSEARRQGEQVTTAAVERLRSNALGGLRRSIGVEGEPPPPCTDAAVAYVNPDSIVRSVHSDLASMLVGGLASLLLQMLHPLAMAGVATHSDYKNDPLGRLGRTARFVGVTTFGSAEDAAFAIEMVKRIHQHVTGETRDGVAYRASDPALLTWVHVAEVRSFLSASLAYGPSDLALDDQDAYVRDMAPVALDLGATEVPRSVEEIDAYLAAVRPQLRFTSEARQARNFVLRGVGRWPHELAAYGILVSAAVGILPSWAARQLRLPLVPLVDRLAVRPAALALCASLRWTTSGPNHVAMVSPPSIATTWPVT